MSELSVEEMLQAARDATGLDNFGEPDMREPLDVLVSAHNREARLTEAGRIAKRADIVRLLSNRLRIQRAFDEHPEIADEPIRGPIVIVGLPRSGTTKLHRMIASDPQIQSLPLWRILNPAPLASGPIPDPDPRLAAAEAYVEAVKLASPAAYAAHPMHAMAPDEDIFAMEFTFYGYRNAMAWNTPSFGAWLDTHSFEPWYIWYKRLLQYIQWQTGSRHTPWLVKAPAHLGFMPLLFKYFPGATVVHCHRDPANTIRSMAALSYEARKGASEVADPVVTGRLILKIWSNFMNRYVTDRAALESAKPFIDAPYQEIVADGMTVIRRIYEAAKIELTPEGLEAMLAWEAGNGAHDHGKFVYGPAEVYGLGDDAIPKAFAAYNQRFAEFQR